MPVMSNNRSLSTSARWYLAIVIAAGLSVVLASALEMYVQQPTGEWLLLAALTLLTGSFTVKIPRLAARLSVSDAFVFAAVLLFGPAVATVIVALDSLVATMWLRRESRSPLRSLFNLSAVAFAIWIAAKSFYLVVGNAPGAALVLPTVLWPLLLLAGIYFLLNTWLVAIALSFEKHTNAVRLWLDNFAWLSLNYLGGVSVASLLVTYTRSIDLAAVSVILPLLVISFLTYRTSMARVDEAQRHVDQIQEFYMSAIETLAMAVDAKDQITHGHIRRVQVYAVELAKTLGVSEERQIKAIEAAALLHDMGKLGIPEHILNKPGRLTTAEFDRMKQHADLGADLLSSIRFPYPVVPIVRHHHENWSGGGYPTGIAGTDIPLGARILSVVDCFDALTSDRPYRPRLSNEEAFAILRERRGSMYDPLVVDAFIQHYPVIAPIAIRAGQEARSVFAADNPMEREHPIKDSLDKIRNTASESVLLMQCAHDIEKSLSVTDALGVAAQYLRRTTPATVYSIYRYDSQVDNLVCTATSGDSQGFLNGLVIPVGQRVSGWTAANERTAINSDAILDLAQIATFFTPPLRSMISAPVRQGHLVGVLAGYSAQESVFTEAHRLAFEQAASAIANKIANAQSSPSSNLVSFPISKH